MIHSLPHRRIHIAITVVFLSAILASCGSYQQASYYDNDGIYADRTEQVRVTQQPRASQPAPKQDAFGEYFDQKANEYGEILESEVFTDVDGYYSDVENDSLMNDQSFQYNGNNNDYNGYAAWGDNPTNVNINVYDNNWGWAGDPFGWGYSGFYGGFYGGYYGYYNPWRWNRYGYGWNNWGWGGYGYYGWGSYYHPYYYSPYYYRPYRHYPYYYSRSRYGNNLYNRSYAYNASRRGTYNSRSSLNSTALRGRSNQNTTTRQSTSRYRSTPSRSNVNRSNTTSRYSRSSTGTTSRSKVGVDAMERNRSYRTSRSTRAVPKYNSSTRRNQTYRSSSPNRSTYKSTAPRTSTYNRSSSTRSSNSTYRSSSPTRSSSSGTYRSSSSSRSSSGSVRSSSSRSSSSSGRSSGRRN